MKNQVLQHFEHLHLTAFAFFIFLSVFIAVIFWIFRKDSNEYYKSVQKLALEDGEKGDKIYEH